MIDLGDDLAALGLLGGGNPTDDTGLVPLVGRNVVRPHNSRTRRLDLIGVPDDAKAIVGYALKGTRQCREIVRAMTVTEQIAAYRAEHRGICRKDILLQLTRAIFNGARDALVAKLRCIKPKSGVPDITRSDPVCAALHRKRMDSRGPHRRK